MPRAPYLAYDCDSGERQRVFIESHAVYGFVLVKPCDVRDLLRSAAASDAKHPQDFVPLALARLAAETLCSRPQSHLQIQATLPVAVRSGATAVSRPNFWPDRSLIGI